MINQILEAKAEKLLREADSYSIPVDILCCTKYLNLQVEEVEIEKDISGFLALRGESAVIGCNKTHGIERKRFTIAHELSHYVLHAKENSPFFIDKKRNAFDSVMFRDTNSSTGEYIQEREANSFAAALLMPKSLIENEIEGLFGNNVDEIVSHLSNKFVVSKQAMSIRLSNLDILDYNVE